MKAVDWTSRHLSPLALLGSALSALAMCSLGLRWSFDGFDVAIVVLGVLLTIALGLGAFVEMLNKAQHGSNNVVDWIAGALGFLLGVGSAALFFGGLSRGRQVRRLGRPVLPGLRSSADWASLPVIRKRPRDPSLDPGRDRMAASTTNAFTPGKLVLGSVLVLATTVSLLKWGGIVNLGLAILIVAWGIVLSGVLGIAALTRSLPTGSERAATRWRLAGTIVASLIGLAMTVIGAVGTLFALLAFSRGRQIRRHGKPVLPGLRANADWSSDAAIALESASYPAGLAEQWRANGKTEHASVAAFARLTLDLMALGAPPALIAAANQDALDEIRHAEICFSLARAIDGQAESPAPFPEAQAVATLPRNRSMALAKVAVDSLVDGALNEGVSARIIAKLARRAELAEIRERLKEIAADEGRHAAHGWDVLEWCLAEGGAPVAAALRGSVGALPRAMRSTMPEDSRSGAWERWGIHGHALEAEEYAAAREHVAARVDKLLAGE